MTLAKKMIRNVLPRGLAPSTAAVGRPMIGWSGGGNYQTYARQGYGGNEIVYSAIELRATSAAEPHIIGRRWRRNRRVSAPTSLVGGWLRDQVSVESAKSQVLAEKRKLKMFGIENRAGAMMADHWLVQNGFIEEVDNHPLVNLLNNPNPFVSRGQLWSSIVMDRDLAGNAYLLKARYPAGSLAAGATAELWRLRPDRVRIVPGGDYIKGYEYTAGQTKVTFKPEDVLHFKTRSPFDDYYGMPPLMPVMGRVAIDNYMTGFVRTFFERGGTGPGSILSVKDSMSQQDKDDIRDRFRRQFGGNAGWHEMLILDNSEGIEYQQMGLNRGLRDAIPKEIDAMNEARIAMIFGIPGSILGLLIGYESSSYANKRQDWQVLWDVTMTPLLSDFDDVLNLGLVPEFGGIDEVVFDLSDIRALQEDVDKLQDRARKNLVVGGWSIEEFRLATGKPALPEPGETFLLPNGATPTLVADLNAEPEPPPAPTHPAAPEPEDLLVAGIRAMVAVEARVGRPRLTEDGQARRIYEEAVGLREANPSMTWEQIAARVGVVERTLRKYRSTFGESDDE